MPMPEHKVFGDVPTVGSGQSCLPFPLVTGQGCNRDALTPTEVDAEFFSALGYGNRMVINLDQRECSGPALGHGQVAVFRDPRSMTPSLMVRV